MVGIHVAKPAKAVHGVCDCGKSEGVKGCNVPVYPPTDFVRYTFVPTSFPEPPSSWLLVLRELFHEQSKEADHET